MKHIISKLLIFCLMCLFLSQCSCDEEPKPIIDPCTKYDTLRANFRMYESPFIQSKELVEYDQDEIAAVKWINFKALDSTANRYEWRVGTDTRVFTGSGSGILFSPDQVGQKIKVTLTVYRKIACKKFDSVATYTRILTVKPQYFTYTYGTWLGIESTNPSDTFKFSIRPIPDSLNNYRNPYKYALMEGYPRTFSLKICEEQYKNVNYLHGQGITLNTLYLSEVKGDYCNDPYEKLFKVHVKDKDSLTCYFFNWDTVYPYNKAIIYNKTLKAKRISYEIN
ncbi:MAG: hypothetical protein NW207_06385 [Cytophagales bacterium]|nr:hypothetical protein [Cytophagales bacterium]